MEALFIYLIKSSGLIALFYVAYYFLLRKETFFTSNRWFLLLGFCTALLLPLVVYTKIIVVEPTLTAIDWSKIPVTTSTEKEFFEINWHLLFGITYAIGILIFMVKFAFDFYSLNTIFKGKTILKQADFRFIDTTENVAPFSYFNTIVYNSSLYNASELENILEHEKVHCEQNHTADVLISRILCILFWFNPLIWFYKKAILQNLEFIADNEATKKISDKKAYQLTLLKITTHENCVAITNHFYQSLIKKRIVMLNKNQSNKKNSWKYAVVIPALVAFMFFFQIDVIAQEKNNGVPEIANFKGALSAVDIYKINKNTTEKELEEIASVININYGIQTTFSKVKRNSSKELIAIRVLLKKGKEISKIMETQENEPIKTFGIVVSKNSKGLLQIDFRTEDKISKEAQISLVAPDAPLTSYKEFFIDGVKANQSELDKINPNDIESIDVIKNSNTQEIRLITKKQSKRNNAKNVIKDNNSEKPVLILNGKITDSDVNLDDIDVKTIATVNVLKGNSATEKYGPKATNGAIEIVTKDNKGWEIRFGTSKPEENIIRIQSDKNVDYKNAVIVIDGKISDYETLNKLKPEEIDKMSVEKIDRNLESRKQWALKKYGDKALNGVIEIETKEFHKK